ncbi:hypothetical protein KIN20_016360, partial [Parelaphostrongylus tenuis]
AAMRDMEIHTLPASACQWQWRSLLQQRHGRRLPAISPSLNAAKALVKRLVIQGVTDVLEQQGHAAGLPDAIIAIILGQLSVNVFYTPLQCHKVMISPANPINQEMMITTCVIVDNTVTTTCPPAPPPAAPPVLGPAAAPVMCMPATGVNFAPIPPEHLSISGTLTTSNIIMANWSREMWQSVVNRVLRMITSGPFRNALRHGICHRHLKPLGWNNNARGVVARHLILHAGGNIGGSDKIVELDESLFTKKRYNAILCFSQQWLFGGTLRKESNEF